MPSPRLQSLPPSGSPPIEGQSKILSADALAFLGELHARFNPERLRLLAARAARQKEIDAGKRPGFLPETRSVREGKWHVHRPPHDLNDRRVEITGPVERKMMINALNSGAKVFMADFEDATSPTWRNIIEGQLNCREAVLRTLSYKSPEGKSYALSPAGLATLVVRPRGWHLPEPRVRDAEGTEISGSLFDFGLYLFHNHQSLAHNKSAPYFYLPKLESHLEARLWNDVFVFAQDRLGIPQGTIRATVLIETILAAFEMEEILYELREHATGLNAGRWDYIFSIIKKFRNDPAFLMPDRSQVTMAVPFMKAYAEQLVRACHRRHALAIGGMAAFIPSRKDPEVNARALERVREDKEREAEMGFDGTWVAHPDLVPVAREIFDRKLGFSSNQKDRLREDVTPDAARLLDTRIEGGKITPEGARLNIDVALTYIEGWIRGVGAAAIHNLMEDAATAEISRAELWQWVRHGRLSRADYEAARDRELARLRAAMPEGRWDVTAAFLDRLVLGAEFEDFLTTMALTSLDPAIPSPEIVPIT